MSVARGTFTVEMFPVSGDDPPGLGRFHLTKSFSGDLVAVSRGTMLTAGDPTTGSAGYVVTEIVTGRLGGRQGSFALQHLGTMDAGESSLSIVVAPGSGTDDLTGLRGTFELTVDPDGTHRYALDHTP